MKQPLERLVFLSKIENTARNKAAATVKTSTCKRFICKKYQKLMSTTENKAATAKQMSEDTVTTSMQKRLAKDQAVNEQQISDSRTSLQV